MDLRLVGLALTGVGLGLGILTQALAPTGFAPIVDASVALTWAPKAFVARGPASSAYDAANDTTYALFRCSHFSCSVLVPFRGDQRGALDTTPVLIVPNDDARPAVHQAPVTVTALYGSSNTALVGSYHLAPHWPYPWGITLGTALAAAGIGMMLGGGPWWPSIGAAAGALLGRYGATLGDGAILAIFAGLLGTLVGVILLGPKRTRRAGLSVTLFGLVTIAVLLLTLPLYPSAPAV